MNVEIRYFSRTGNVAKMADIIGQALKIPAKSIETPLSDTTDLLLFGASIYVARPSHEAQQFVKQLDPGKVKQIGFFGTAGGPLTVEHKLAELSDKQGIAKIAPELFLHGLMPNTHQFNDKQVAAIKAYAAEISALLNSSEASKGVSL